MKKSLLAALFLTGCGFEVVDTGFRGVEVRFGAPQGTPLNEGLHFYNPFTSDIVELEVREQKLENKTACFTRDTQNVEVAYAVTYYPDPSQIGALYQTLGHEWSEKIVVPIVLQAIKDVVGQYAADDLVGKREEARNKAQAHLTDQLKARNVNVTTLSFTNLDFDAKYEEAVEAKVVAVQKAAEAKNKTVEIEENAKQRVVAAEAEAKSMQIRSQALSQNRGLVEYEAVQKWDGKLPQYMTSGSPMPFLSLNVKGQ